jgi:hypothetical protein
MAHRGFVDRTNLIHAGHGAVDRLESVTLVIFSSRSLHVSTTCRAVSGDASSLANTLFFPLPQHLHAEFSRRENAGAANMA